MHAYMYVRGEEGGASLKNKKRKKKIPAPSGGHDCGRGKERHGRRCVHCTQSISPIFSFPSLFIDSHTSFSSLSRCNIYITSVFFYLEHGFSSSSSLLSCPLLCCHFFVLGMFYLRSYGILFYVCAYYVGRCGLLGEGTRQIPQSCVFHR